MNSSEQRDEMFALLEAHCEERLAASETQRLQRLVVDNEETAWLYVRYMHQHALLERCEQGFNFGQLVDLLAGGATICETVSQQDFPAPLPGHWMKAWHKVSQAVRQMSIVSLSAAVVVVGTVLVGLAIVAAPKFQRMQQANVLPPAIPKPYAARLTKTQDAQWDDEGRLFLGRHLRAGYRVKLKAGLAELTFKDGAVVVLEGPTNLEIISKAETHLETGCLVAHVPAKAVGFAVTAGEATIVDLGTEFGVAVNADGRADVHVFEGMVSVELSPAADGQGGRPIQRIVMANEAVRVDPGSGTVQVAPKDIARQFVRAVPEKAKQGVTHPLVLKNPSFERPDIRRHPRFNQDARSLLITAMGWHASEFPGLGAPGGTGWQGQYAVSDNAKQPITPPATDGNQLIYLSLDKTHPEYHQGWMYQSLGTVDEKDVGRRLRLQADVSAKGFYLGTPNSPRDGATVTAAFAVGVTAVEPGQVVGTAGTWPELLVDQGWKTLETTLTITSEMFGQEIFVRLHVSDPQPQTIRDIYQWDNVRCVVAP